MYSHELWYILIFPNELNAPAVGFCVDFIVVADLQCPVTRGGPRISDMLDSFSISVLNNSEIIKSQTNTHSTMSSLWVLIRWGLSAENNLKCYHLKANYGW